MVRTHIVLPSSFVNQLDRVLFYIWKRLLVTGKVKLIQTPNNDVVTPRFSRCMLIVPCIQPLTELFYKFQTRESAR